MLLALIQHATDAVAQEAITTPRYVDASAGDDSNDGMSPETAWQTLEKVNEQEFGPGAAILFKSGESWTGRLLPQGSGAEGAPIVVDRYEEGALPAIHGEGVASVILLVNQEYWEINNLEITNLQDVSGGQPLTRKRGVHIGARDMGEVNHIHLRGLVVHDVNSEQETFDSRYYGGIFFEIAGSAEPTWFDDLRVEDCHIYDVDRTGISTESSWWERGEDSAFGDVLANTGTGPDRTDRWVPSTNVIIRNNLLEHIGGNGVIVRVARQALVEGNRVFHAGEDISGNGMFCFNTDSTFFQFNEVAYTVYNRGDTDARGIDSDYRTKHTVIQYNYLHHNGYGGVVATGGPGGATSVPRFNHGTAIRYNILVDNEDHVVRASGNLSDMTVHNNVIYTSEEYENSGTLTLVNHSDWSGAWPTRSSYFNNLFATHGAAPRYALGQSSFNTFENNLYWGQPASNRPFDPAAIEADPLFIAPTTADGWEGLEGFMISDGSPAIDAGRTVEGAPATDFFGNAVAAGAAVDVGVHETATSVKRDRPPAVSAHPAPSVYPNPVGVHATVSLHVHEPGVTTFSVVDLLGRTVTAWQERLQRGHNQLQIEPAALRLPAGVYFLRITRRDGTVESADFVWLGASR